MRIIELTGCSGVGKSTLQEALISAGLGSRKFICSDEHARQILTRQILKRDNSYLRYLFLPGIKIPLVNSFLCRKILDGRFKMGLLEHHKEWEKCLHSLFMRHSNSTKTLRSLYRYSALLTRMESQSFYQSFPCDYLLVLDSGLFYKIASILILLEANQIDFATDEIYSTLPVIPDGIIYLIATPEIICDRIHSRERLKSSTIQEFKDLKKDNVYKRILLEEKVNRRGVEILKSRGAKVVEVNAADSIGIQVKTAIEFIGQMKTEITINVGPDNEPHRNINAGGPGNLKSTSVNAKSP
jgi:hypothetical protein